MGKGKYLAKNIGLLTIGQLGTKFLGFFLVPLYTSILTTSDYGVYDIINSSIGILVPIFTLNVYDGVLRFTLDKEIDDNDVFSIGIKYLIISNAIIIILLSINYYFDFNSLINNYIVFFILMFFIQSASGVIITFVRGIDRILDLSISGIICSVIIIICNIVFLCVFNWGLNGYFIANIIGPLVQIIYLFIRIKGWNYCHRHANFKVIEKSMLTYSIPLIANSIAWWFNGLSDKYIVTWFCGLAENGIYSVASKIPSILNIFQTIFNQAWTLSAVKDFDHEDKNGFFTNMYNAYNCINVIACSVLIIINRPIAKILYAKDFFAAWQYVPFLMMAIVFGALSGYLGGIYAAVKDTKEFARTTVIGAILNIVLNIITVPFIGALGAAIVTAISYFVVYLLRIKCIKRYINIRIRLSRDLVSYGILLIQSIMFLIIHTKTFTLYLCEIILTIVIVLLYLKEIRNNYSKLISTVIRRG